MASFLEDLLKKMQNAPHVGIPPVTNPKVPTKVERDAAAFEARQREMSKFHFGTGSQLDDIINRMRNSSHVCMVYADPAFKNTSSISEAELEAFSANYPAFVDKWKSEKVQRRHTAMPYKLNQENA